MSAPENPQAFPGDNNFYQPGMSLRDWFAGQALVGTIVDQASWGVDHSKKAPDFARIAFDIADAMLAEREKGGAR